jgi:transcriptional regulator with XRE-family HTH domain
MSNLLLRAARQQKGWNQQQLADFAALSLSTIERAERGEPIRVDSIQRLCTCLHKPPEQLGLLNGAHEESESEDMNRRQTLQILGTGTALLVGVPPAHLNLQEVETLFTRKMARLQTWIVEGLEDGTRLRWQLYYTSRNTLTEDGLLNQITKLELLADDGGKDHARICQVLAQNVKLLTTLRAIAVVGFVLMSRLKEVSFKGLYEATLPKESQPLRDVSRSSIPRSRNR